MRIVCNGLWTSMSLNHIATDKSSKVPTDWRLILLPMKVARSADRI